MIQLEKTMEAIADKVDVEFNDQPLFTPALLLQTYDIVHLWNFSMEWTKYQLWAASKHKRKIVCSMIYHETEQFIPFENQQIMIDSLDAYIFLTEGEVERAQRHLKLDPKKIHIIPNGIDKWWFKPTKEKNIYGDYVLTVGRIEDAKGQIATAKACKALGITYLCAGEIIDPGTAQLVKDAGGVLLGKKTMEQLKPLYKHAKTVVCASMHEIYPLVVMEAGSQGTNIVLTTGSEWKAIPNVEMCEFDNVQSIKSAIEKAIKKPKNKEFQDMLKKMTWKDVGNQVLQVYKSII